MKIFAIAALGASAFLLTACGSKLEGTYSMDSFMGKTGYTFDSNGTAYQEIGGMKVEMKYELDGKNVKLITPQGTAVLTLVDANTIEGPMGMKFIKQK